MIRRVFYASPNAPPRDWLIYASLLWDKIWVGPAFPTNLFHTLSRISRKSSKISERERLLLKNESFYKDIASTDIFDRTETTIKLESLTKEERELYQATVDGTIRRELKRLGATPYELSLLPGASEGILRFLSQTSPDKALEVFPDLDFFFDDKKSFGAVFPLTGNVIVRSIQAAVPLRPDSVTVPQIMEFREKHRSQRTKLRYEIEANKFFNSILSCSTPQELKDQLKLCEEYICEQLDLLNATYRECEISVAKKIMGIAYSPPALVSALCSALHIPFYVPGVIISAMMLETAEILSLLQMQKAKIGRSPWGYLRELKKL